MTLTDAATDVEELALTMEDDEKVFLETILKSSSVASILPCRCPTLLVRSLSWRLLMWFRRCSRSGSTFVEACGLNRVKRTSTGELESFRIKFILQIRADTENEVTALENRASGIKVWFLI